MSAGARGRWLALCALAAVTTATAFAAPETARAQKGGRRTPRSLT